MMTMRSVGSFWFVAMFAGWMAAGMGCETSQEAPHEHEGDLLEEFCEHMKEGPGVSVTAVAWMERDPPSLSAPHTRYDVQLVPVEGGQGGDVIYPVSHAGELAIALSRDVPIRVLRQSDGVEIPFEEEVPTGEIPCDEVVRVATVPVTIGTVLLRLGPTTGEGVSLVIESGAHSHESES